MKQLLIAFLFLSGAATSFGQSAMRISLADRSLITVSVDSRYFNKRGQSVTIGDLPPGRHYVKIFTTYQNRRGRMVEQTSFEGRVKTYSGHITYFTYDPNSNTISETEQEMGISGNPQPNYNNDMANTQPPADNYNPGNNQPAASPAASTDMAAAVGEAKLEKAKKKAATKNTDTEKFNAVKEALDNEQFTCAQIAGIMDIFSFESTKVDFAEWAYPKTIDKQSFSILKDKLTYQSYREDLDKFVSNNR